MTKDGELTLSEIGDLIRDGHNGLMANLDYETLKETVENWKNQRPQDWEAIKDLPNLEHFIGATVEYDHQKGTKIASKPNSASNLKEIASSEGMPDEKFRLLDKFTDDFFQNYIERIRNLQEKSSLTKNQFIAYLMKTNNKKGIVISQTLDINESTVSSHVSRAKEKVERAKKTAEIDDLMNRGNFHELRDKRKEILS